MIITNVYVYNNIKLNETRNIIGNTSIEHHQKHGYNRDAEVNVKFKVKFLIKKKTKRKIICSNMKTSLGK